MAHCIVLCKPRALLNPTDELAGIGKSLDATHLAASPTTVIAQSDETALTPKADSGKNKGKQIELLDENDVDIVRQSQHEDPFATETDAAQILGKGMTKKPNQMFEN